MATKAQQTYERVEALVAEGTDKPEALKQVAKETSRSVDTVSNSYYAGRRQVNGTGTTARGSHSRARRETTTEDAVRDAISTLEKAIEKIQKEVQIANDRADEAQLEYDAVREAAGPRILEIKAKIAALEGDPA
jgi:hypothetical protein